MPILVVCLSKTNKMVGIVTSADLNKLNTMSLTPRLRDAIWFAMEKHQGQLRKGGEPYILHCLRVMLRMNTEEEMVVAVLHDVVEDTDATIQDIYHGFGTQTGLLVGHLTRDEGEEYMKYIERTTNSDVSARVKYADMADNWLNLDKLPNRDEASFLEKRYRRAMSVLRALGFSILGSSLLKEEGR